MTCGGQWTRYLDEDPGEAAHAEQHGDGQQDVGHQAQQHRGPVDLMITHYDRWRAYRRWF